MRVALSVFDDPAVFATVVVGEAEDSADAGGKDVVDEFVVVASIIFFSLLNETQLMSHES
jgi:hypothetical protein